jgi:hypothetical protein
MKVINRLWRHDGNSRGGLALGVHQPCWLRRPRVRPDAKDT